MTGFDSFAIVDWSAGNDTGPRPKKDAIWVGAVLGCIEQEPTYLRNRPLAFEHLCNLISGERRADRRLMIGLDFPFAYPTGFAERLKCVSNSELWSYFHDNLRDNPKGNNRFELAGRINALFPGDGPFWFNGLKTDVAGLPRKKPRMPVHGQKDKRRIEERTKGTFTCWQMGGAGAVGGQIMTGMAFLSKLLSRFGRDIAVWPFEELDAPIILTEIWPSLIEAAVKAEDDPIKDRAQVKLLSNAFARLRPERLQAMLDIETDEEGWILGAGFEEELLRATCR